jgi:hypothetical protein
MTKLENADIVLTNFNKFYFIIMFQNLFFSYKM